MGQHHDPVNHPSHYAANKIAGLECIEVTRHFLFSPGNTIKYVWRPGFKIDDMEDLAKADFYLNDAEESRPLVGTTAKEVAYRLKNHKGLDRREKIVVDIVVSLADKMYNNARDSIEELRDYLKENTNAGEDSNQDE